MPSTDKHKAPNNEMNNASNGTKRAKKTVAIERVREGTMIDSFDMRHLIIYEFAGRFTYMLSTQ